MEIIHGNAENFDDVINSDLVLVDFFATWCGPCKMLSPVLESLSNTRNNTKIVKIDIDQNETLTKRFGVMSVPTLILFKKGIEVDKKIGYMSEEELNNWIEENK